MHCLTALDWSQNQVDTIVRQIYGVVFSFDRKVQTPQGSDLNVDKVDGEGIPYLLYSLSNMHQKAFLKEPPWRDLAANDQLWTALANDKQPSVLPAQSIAWAYLGAKRVHHPSELKWRELLLKVDPVQHQPQEEEKFFLHDSSIKTDAALLLAFIEAGDSEAKSAVLKDRIISDFRMGRFSNNSDIALALVAVDQYIRHHSGEQALNSMAFRRVDSSGELQARYGYTEPAPSKTVLIDTRKSRARGTSSAGVDHGGASSGVISSRKNLSNDNYVCLEMSDSSRNPRNAGIYVRRTYEAGDSKSKVWRTADGAWHSSLDSKIRCTIDFSPGKYLNNVILTDYLPAGLKTSQPQLPMNVYNGPMIEPSYEWNYQKRWQQASNVNLNYIRAFGTNLPPANYTYSYLLDAIAVGEFGVPSAIVTSPFDLPVDGRSGADKFVVEVK